MKDSAESKVSRRDVLKITTLGVAAVATAKIAVKANAQDTTRSKSRFAMAIDLRKCTGCHTCSVACKSEFAVPLGVFRSWVEVKEEGKYPNVKKFFSHKLCNHCDNPSCVPVCPVNATHVREDGIVVVNSRKCIGCKACVAACPYNARFANPITHTADKCDFCLHRVENGVVPSCVNACPAKTRIFGDLAKSDSEVSRLIKKHATDVLRPEWGTDPQVYYILPDGFTGLGGNKNA